MLPGRGLVDGLFLHRCLDSSRRKRQRVRPLRHDALQPHAADTIEHGWAVTRQVFGEPDGIPLGCQVVWRAVTCARSTAGRAGRRRHARSGRRRTAPPRCPGACHQRWPGHLTARTINRYPSCLISRGQSGSIKPEGRRKTTEDRRIRLRRWLRGINFTVHRRTSPERRSREPRYSPLGEQFEPQRISMARRLPKFIVVLRELVCE